MYIKYALSIEKETSRILTIQLQLGVLISVQPTLSSWNCSKKTCVKPIRALQRPANNIAKRTKLLMMTLIIMMTMVMMI